MRRICAALDLPQAIPSRSSSRGRSDPTAIQDRGRSDPAAIQDRGRSDPAAIQDRGRSDSSVIPACGDVQAWWYTCYLSPVVGEGALCPSSARYSLNVLEIGAGAGPSPARPDRAEARQPPCGAAQHVTGRSSSPRGARADWMSATV